MKKVIRLSEKYYISGELETIEELSSSTLCKVTLVKNLSDGRKYVKREYNDDKSALFERLREADCDSFAKTYVILQNGGKTTTIDEYIEGETLLSLLENDKFSGEDIPKLAVWLVYAIGILHKNGIVHGDIKPANIIICPDGSLKLIDFGVSRLVGDEGKTYFGTMGYAAPEQFVAKEHDFRTDIYSLGVTLQRTAEITGYKGFIRKIYEKCVNCEPEKRFQSAPEILKAIARHNRLEKALLTIGTISAVVILIILIAFFISNF